MSLSHHSSLLVTLLAVTDVPLISTTIICDKLYQDIHYRRKNVCLRNVKEQKKEEDVGRDLAQIYREIYDV